MARGCGLRRALRVRADRCARVLGLDERVAMGSRGKVLVSSVAPPIEALDRAIALLDDTIRIRSEVYVRHRALFEGDDEEKLLDALVIVADWMRDVRRSVSQ